MSTVDPALSLTNVSKSFGKKRVVDRVSLDVMPGEVLGFLGPNGAGKTTTIKMIMGFLSLDEGKITIAGYDYRKEYEKAMSLLGGIVENPEMYKDLSGQLNLELYARLHPGVTKERIREVVEMVGMQERIGERVRKYSLGMKQRIGLAQAILHKPRILILDEPTNGLDPAGIHELRDILKRLAHEEGVAVMVSSHLLSEMQLMCDRVAIIQGGKILDVKPIGQLTAMADGRSVFRILTPSPDAAFRALTEPFQAAVLSKENDHIDLEITADDVTTVLSILLRETVTMYGFFKLEASLEDAFLQLTGGGIDIA